MVRDCPGLCLLSTSTPTLHPVQAHRPWNGGFLSSSGPGGRPLGRWGQVWEEGADLVPGGDLVVSLEVLMVLGRTWVLSSLPRARESVCPHLAGARPRCWSRKTAAGKASVTSLGTIPPGLVMLGHGAAEPQSRTGRIPSEGLDDPCSSWSVQKWGGSQLPCLTVEGQQRPGPSSRDPIPAWLLSAVDFGRSMPPCASVSPSVKWENSDPTPWIWASQPTDSTWTSAPRTSGDLSVSCQCCCEGCCSPP